VSAREPGSFLHATLALAAVLALGVTARPALAADEALALEVTINGASTHKIGEFMRRDGALLARPDELGELGLRVAPDTPRTPDGMVDVGRLPGVSFSLDPAAQTLRLSAQPDRLVGSLLTARPETVSDAPLESGAGATLNYDLTDSVAGGRHSASGAFDLRLFSPWGVASTGALAYARADRAHASGATAIRLDSTYVYSDFGRQRRYRLGDTISGGLAWTRPVRLGGAQLSHDFSMRPDLVTFPVPLVEGSAAVPSTVDVLVNGARVLSGQVDPGPFQVSQLPVLSGAGSVSMTVRDALGRQVTTTLPFYASPALLAEGLRTWSVEAGAVRRDWGVVSNDYGALAASAIWRGGLSPTLTVEAHAEGTSGQAMFGAGLVADVFHLAVANLAVAGSSASGRQGVQVSVGVDRLARGFSFGASGVFATADYRDVAAMNGDPVTIRQINANAGVSLGRWGSAGVAYALSDRKLSTLPGRGLTSLAPGVGFPFGTAQKVRVLTASYSLQIGRASLYASGFHDFVRGGGDGATIGLTVPLGPRNSVTASANTGSSPHVTLQAQQSVNAIGDWGYQLFLGGGGREHEFAQGQYKAPWALLTAGVDRQSGETTGRLDVQGAVSLLDGRLFASNPIYGSFAVVDAGGVAGVPVLYENRDAGRTDASGRRLVPDLRSFDVNRLSIDPTGLPPDVLAPQTAREVRPPERSGVVVKFPVRIAHAALVVLQDEQGRPLPVGSMATLRPGGVASPVGYDGEAFFEDLSPRNRLDVRLQDGSGCAVAFDYAPLKGDVPKIGPIVCRRGPR
jgi:outer membrane usher protein